LGQVNRRDATVVTFEAEVQMEGAPRNRLEGSSGGVICAEQEERLVPNDCSPSVRPRQRMARRRR